MDYLVGRLGNDKFNFVTLACNIITLAIVDKIKELRATGAEYAVWVLEHYEPLKPSPIFRTAIFCKLASDVFLYKSWDFLFSHEYKIFLWT